MPLWGHPVFLGLEIDPPARRHIISSHPIGVLNDGGGLLRGKVVMQEPERAFMKKLPERGIPPEVFRAVAIIPPEGPGIPYFLRISRTVAAYVAADSAFVDKGSFPVEMPNSESRTSFPPESQRVNSTR